MSHVRTGLLNGLVSTPHVNPVMWYLHGKALKAAKRNILFYTNAIICQMNHLTGNTLVIVYSFSNITENSYNIFSKHLFNYSFHFLVVLLRSLSNCNYNS